MMSPLMEIEKLAQHYFDALYRGDVELFRTIFHPNARLFSVNGGAETVLNVDQYLSIVSDRENPVDRGDPRQDQILSIDLSTSTTAVLKTRELFLPKRFTDDLGLVRWSGGWRIVAKIWDFELIEEGFKP